MLPTQRRDGSVDFADPAGQETRDSGPQGSREWSATATAAATSGHAPTRVALGGPSPAALRRRCASEKA